MKLRFLILLSACLIIVSQLSAQKSNSLNGKKFSITLKPSGDERPGRTWTKDVLSFIDNKLVSKEMSEEKFPPFEYTFTNENGIIRFTASGKNPYVSSIEWKGTVSGDSIQGEAIWTNASGPEIYEFSSSLEKK
jgi:hypothetical protein